MGNLLGKILRGIKMKEVKRYMPIIIHHGIKGIQERSEMVPSAEYGEWYSKADYEMLSKECDKEHMALGLCGKHYQRWFHFRKDNPDATINNWLEGWNKKHVEKEELELTKECWVPECKKNHTRKDLCYHHYQAWSSYSKQWPEDSREYWLKVSRRCQKRCVHCGKIGRSSSYRGCCNKCAAKLRNGDL